MPRLDLNLHRMQWSVMRRTIVIEIAADLPEDYSKAWEWLKTGFPSTRRIRLWLSRWRPYLCVCATRCPFLQTLFAETPLPFVIPKLDFSCTLHILWRLANLQKIVWTLQNAKMENLAPCVGVYIYRKHWSFVLQSTLYGLRFQTSFNWCSPLERCTECCRFTWTLSPKIIVKKTRITELWHIGIDAITIHITKTRFFWTNHTLHHHYHSYFIIYRRWNV